MFQPRQLVRTPISGAIRSARRPARRQIRFQSTSTAASGTNASGASSFGAGVAGGVAGALTLYSIYYVTPAGKTQRAINSTAKQVNDTYKEASKKLQENTPTADQALDSIRQFAYSYIGWIPGGRAYVDAAFKDIDTIRENRREEADKIVNDAYKKLQHVSKSGLSLETLSRAYDVLADLSQQVAKLAGHSVSDLLDNHPELNEKLGGNIDQLKDLGEKYGPEAKKQVDQTWEEIQDIASGGLSASSLDKARRLIDDKVQQLRKLGDEAWDKALKEAKPYLDKNPKVKELVEKNADALKQGDAKELFERAKSAAQSGDLGDLEKYVSGAVDKVKSKGSKLSSSLGIELDHYVKMIPDGDKFIPRLQELGEVATKHKDEGEQLLKETAKELNQVLEKKAKEAQEIIRKAKNEAK